MDPTDFHSIFFPSTGYPYSSKYIILCSVEDRN